jgi:hypothetical protein
MKEKEWELGIAKGRERPEATLAESWKRREERDGRQLGFGRTSVGAVERWEATVVVGAVTVGGSGRCSCTRLESSTAGFKLP